MVGGPIQARDIFQGFVTGPDGSVYRQTEHYLNDYRGGEATWTTLDLVQAGTPGAAGEAAATGVNPTETSYSLYGHTVPLSVLGLARIGGEIIAGPWVENGAASFCISFGVPADHTGTRSVKEIAFDSEVMWTAEDGYSNENHFTFRWYEGTLTQVADPLEISHFGADAVAYRPQMLIWFETLPLANTKFGKIPYVAALIEDGTGRDVNLGECFERLAYSPYVGFTPDQFETEGITDGLIDGGMIFVEQADFLSTIQQFGRFYRNWDIIQTNKLKIVDHGGNVTADVVLDKTSLMDNIIYSRAEPNSISRELILSTIDNESDYTIIPSTAKRPLHPVAVTASVRTESGYLPIITDPFTRQALVTYTKYQEEITRKKISGKATMRGLEMEPGDRIALAGLGPDFANEVFKVTRTTHGVNNVVEFSAEALFNCESSLVDPYWSYVVLLMGYEPGKGFVDESPQLQGAATQNEGSEIDTTHSKFGTRSLRPTIWYTWNADWDLSNSNSDEFTVECWARLDVTAAGLQTMVGGSYVEALWDLSVYGTELKFSWRTATGVEHAVTSSGAGIVGGIWYYFAVDKDSTGKIRLYKNGVMVASATPLNSAMDNGGDNNLTIGFVSTWVLQVWEGNLDEIRITKGVARYKSDAGFSVPASAFPRSGEGS